MGDNSNSTGMCNIHSHWFSSYFVWIWILRGQMCDGTDVTLSHIFTGIHTQKAYTHTGISSSQCVRQTLCTLIKESSTILLAECATSFSKGGFAKYLPILLAFMNEFICMKMSLLVYPLKKRVHWRWITRIWEVCNYCTESFLGTVYMYMKLSFILERLHSFKRSRCPHNQSIVKANNKV